jgi:hypothetical protein
MINFRPGTTLVTGIKHLQVGSSWFDVTFIEGTYNGVYPSPALPTFFNDVTGAGQAASAIAQTLTGSRATDFARTKAVSKNVHVPWSIPTGTPAPSGTPGMFPSVDPDGNGLFSLDFGFPNATEIFLWPVFTPGKRPDVSKNRP